jgi:hypothetical protein
MCRFHNDDGTPTSERGSLSQAGGSIDMVEERFAKLLGHAAIDVWGEMPRDIQEALFETAMKGHASEREALARLLHDRHPRTSHPPKPD